MNTPTPEFSRRRREHWDRVARQMDTAHSLGGAYHQRLKELYRFLVTPGLRVLEVGCGTGDLLAALDPSTGVGVDFSPEMIIRARRRHPQLQFVLADGQSLPFGQSFDVIILSDLLNDVWDAQVVLEQVRRLSGTGTRIVVNSYSRLWEMPLAAAEKLGVAKPVIRRNWLAPNDMTNLMELSGLDVFRHWQEMLWPLPPRVVERWANRFLVKLWPLNLLALTNFFVARPQPDAADCEHTVSVIVPARNEAGHMPGVMDRIPDMGRGTEVVFVEGHSVDNTYEAIREELAAHPDRKACLLRQEGKGKGDAVRLGFDHAQGDVLMILDADLTVAPEYLPRFFAALCEGKGDFINGVRLVYPMEQEAMRFFNLTGNKLFSLLFTWLLGQPVKDTLCGTKVLWKRDYRLIADNRAYFGDFDPFGDFDLLFGAARLGMKIVDMPLRYGSRSYGSTNIERWRHGLLLLRMAVFALFRLKFV